MENTGISLKTGELESQKVEGEIGSEDMVTEETDFVQTKCSIVAALYKAMALQNRNKDLSKQLEEERNRSEEAQSTIKALKEKLEVWESDSFYKAVNINTILEYAQDPDNCDKNDVAVIKLMLLGLCSNKVPDDIIRKIKRLRCGGKLNIGAVGQMNPAATVVNNHYHND